MGRKAQSTVRLDVRLFDSGVWARLTPRARHILPLILRYMDRASGVSFVGQRKLQARAGLGSQRTVARAIEDLVKAGIIDAERCHGRRTEYRLSERYLELESDALHGDAVSDNVRRSTAALKGASVPLPPESEKCVTPGHKVHHSQTKVMHPGVIPIHKKYPEDRSSGENPSEQGQQGKRLYGLDDLNRDAGLREWLSRR